MASEQRIISFRDLDAWNLGMELCEASYAFAKLLPLYERFELSSQIRKASVSIPANIAEGHATRLPGRCAYHVRIALGSLGELETELELARRLGYLSQSQLQTVSGPIQRVGQLLHGLLRAKEAQARKSTVIALTLFIAPTLTWLLLSVFR